MLSDPEGRLLKTAVATDSLGWCDQLFDSAGGRRKETLASGRVHQRGYLCRRERTRLRAMSRWEKRVLALVVMSLAAIEGRNVLGQGVSRDWSTNYDALVALAGLAFWLCCTSRRHWSLANERPNELRGLPYSICFWVGLFLDG